MARDLQTEFDAIDNFMSSPFGKELSQLDKMLVPYWGEADDYGFMHTFVYDIMDMCIDGCTTPDKAFAYILGTLCNYDMIVCKDGFENMPPIEERTLSDFYCDPDKDDDHKAIWAQLQKIDALLLTNVLN